MRNLTNEEIKALKAGDKVYWEDPDCGKMSGVATIASISFKYTDDSEAEVASVHIVDQDGEFEALVHELFSAKVNATVAVGSLDRTWYEIEIKGIELDKDELVFEDMTQEAIIFEAQRILDERKETYSFVAVIHYEDE